MIALFLSFEAPIDIYAVNMYSCSTLLHSAICYRWQVIGVPLANGAEANAQDDYGRIELILAAKFWGGRQDIFLNGYSGRYWCEVWGMYPSLQDRSGKTVLYVLMKWDDCVKEELVRLLDGGGCCSEEYRCAQLRGETGSYRLGQNTLKSWCEDWCGGRSTAISGRGNKLLYPLVVISVINVNI